MKFQGYDTNALWQVFQMSNILFLNATKSYTSHSVYKNCSESKKFKVHIFWEGHILQNLHRSPSQIYTVKIFQIFVAFSEYMNFNM